MTSILQNPLRLVWQVVVPSYFPRLKNPRAYAEWFLPIMIHDAAALHSSIFAWSAHLEVVKGLSVRDRSLASTPQWPQHRLRAIQAVNAKLNDPRQALEVSTLLAVGNLMAANVSQAVSIVRSAFFSVSTRSCPGSF